MEKRFASYFKIKNGDLYLLFAYIENNYSILTADWLLFDNIHPSQLIVEFQIFHGTADNEKEIETIHVNSSNELMLNTATPLQLSNV